MLERVFGGNRLETDNSDNSAKIMFTGQSRDARQRRHSDRILQLHGPRRSSGSRRLRGGQGRIQSDIKLRCAVRFGDRTGGWRWSSSCSKRFPENVHGFDPPHQSKHAR